MEHRSRGCSHDQIIPRARELAESIPGAEYKEIAAGHLAYFEAADEFIALAIEFMRRHGR
jgi:pimeloyl-ACP methyl ester carboxylesterase